MALNKNIVYSCPKCGSVTKNFYLCDNCIKKGKKLSTWG